MSKNKRLHNRAKPTSRRHATALLARLPEPDPHWWGMFFRLTDGSGLAMATSTRLSVADMSEDEIAIAALRAVLDWAPDLEGLMLGSTVVLQQFDDESSVDDFMQEQVRLAAEDGIHLRNPPPINQEQWNAALMVLRARGVIRPAGNPDEWVTLRRMTYADTEAVGRSLHAQGLCNCGCRQNVALN